MKTDDNINNLRIEIMEKIDDIKRDVGDIKIEIAKLPETLADKFDSKYASKKLEEDVYDLNEKVGDLRDWKIKIVAILSMIMFLFTFLKDPIMKALGIE